MLTAVRATVGATLVVARHGDMPLRLVHGSPLCGRPQGSPLPCRRTSAQPCRLARKFLVLHLSPLASPTLLTLGIAQAIYLQMNVGCTRQSESELSLHSLERHLALHSLNRKVHHSPFSIHHVRPLRGHHLRHADVSCTAGRCTSASAYHRVSHLDSSRLYGMSKLLSLR